MMYLDSMTYQVEKMLGENRDKISGSDVQNLENAISEAREALSKAPASVTDQPLMKVADGHVMLYEGKTAEARASFEAALKVDPNDFFALRNQAALLAKLNKAILNVRRVRDRLVDGDRPRGGRPDNGLNG